MFRLPAFSILTFLSIYKLSFYYLIITVEKSRASHETPEPYTIYNPAWGRGYTESDFLFEEDQCWLRDFCCRINFCNVSILSSIKEVIINNVWDVSSNRYWSEQNFYISGNFFQTRLLHSTLPGSIIQRECNIYVRSLFFTTSRSARQMGRGQQAAIQVWKSGKWGCLKIWAVIGRHTV